MGLWEMQIRMPTTWDLQSDEPGLELNAAASSQDFRGDSVTVTYSPCGQFLASTGVDYVVNLWRRRSVGGDVETWSCAFALCVFHDFIVDISWNPVVPTEFVQPVMMGLPECGECLAMMESSPLRCSGEPILGGFALQVWLLRVYLA